MPRTLTGNSRDRERRLQSLMLDRLVLKYERRLASEIRRSMFGAARAVQDGNPVPDSAQHERRMRALLNNLWGDSGRQFAEHILGKEQAARGPDHRKRTVGVTATTIMDGVMREWIQEYGGRKIKEITTTTMDDINTVVRNGIKDGDDEITLTHSPRSSSCSSDHEPISMAGSCCQSIFGRLPLAANRSIDFRNAPLTITSPSLSCTPNTDA